MTGITVTELHTQDGWDWPNGCGDERWPSGEQQPPAPAPRKHPLSYDPDDGWLAAHLLGVSFAPPRRRGEPS